MWKMCMTKGCWSNPRQSVMSCSWALCVRILMSPLFLWRPLFLVFFFFFFVTAQTLRPPKKKKKCRKWRKFKDNHPYFKLNQQRNFFKLKWTSWRDSGCLYLGLNPNLQRKLNLPVSIDLKPLQPLASDNQHCTIQQTSPCPQTCHQPPKKNVNN